MIANTRLLLISRREMSREDPTTVRQIDLRNGSNHAGVVSAPSDADPTKATYLAKTPER